MRQQPHKLGTAMKLLCTLCCVPAVTAFGQSTPYIVTAIGNPLFATQAFGLNDSGQVVGQEVFADGSSHAFSWSAADGIIDLGTLPGGATSTAIAVNNAGQVLGYSESAGDAPLTHGFIWQPATGLTDLTPGSPLSVMPRGINATGQVAGTILNGTLSGGASGFIYTPGVGLAPASITGNTVADVYAYNTQGQIAARVSGADNVLFANPGQAAVEIAAGHLVSGAATAMNAGGTVAGYIDPDNGLLPHAYSWNEVVGVTDLTPGADSSGIARAINDLGQIVGTASIDGSDNFPFLYDGGILFNLNTLLGSAATGWTGITPEAINNEGQIAGFGWYGNEQTAFLISPDVVGGSLSVSTPEPTTLPILLTTALPLLRRHPRKSP